MLCFFEASTRTELSFEMAGLRLGMAWSKVEPSGLSLQKGESLRDTFQVLSHYKPDLFVVRHSVAYLPHAVSEWTGVPVINAGDGINEHPTQALIDTFTLWKMNSKKRYSIAFFGDVFRSRVARSNLKIWKALNWNVSVVDDGSENTKNFAKAFGIRVIPRRGIREADVIYCLRVQAERGSSYALSPLSNSDLSKKSKFMHAGPVVMGKDMLLELCERAHPQSLIHEQLKNSLPVREAILDEVLKRARA